MFFCCLVSLYFLFLNVCHYLWLFTKACIHLFLVFLCCEIQLNVINAILMMIMTGFFRPPLERPPINNVGFQHANPGNIPTHPITGNFVILHFLTVFLVSPFELPIVNKLHLCIKIINSFFRTWCSSDVVL